MKPLPAPIVTSDDVTAAAKGAGTFDALDVLRCAWQRLYRDAGLQIPVAPATSREEHEIDAWWKTLRRRSSALLRKLERRGTLESVRPSHFLPGAGQQSATYRFRAE